MSKQLFWFILKQVCLWQVWQINLFAHSFRKQNKNKDSEFFLSPSQCNDRNNYNFGRKIVSFYDRSLMTTSSGRGFDDQEKKLVSHWLLFWLTNISGGWLFCWLSSFVCCFLLRSRISENKALKLSAKHWKFFVYLKNPRISEEGCFWSRKLCKFTNWTYCRWLDTIDGSHAFGILWIESYSYLVCWRYFNVDLLGNQWFFIKSALICWKLVYKSCFAIDVKY